VHLINISMQNGGPELSSILMHISLVNNFEFVGDDSVNV